MTKHLLRPLDGLRWLYGLFFVGMGSFILLHLLTGLGGPPRQPTAQAQAFMDALSASRFIDPLLAVGFIAGGATLLVRRTAPLGLVLLAGPVLVILFFHLVLSGQWIVGLLTAGIWAVLAWEERRRFSALWSR